MLTSRRADFTAPRTARRTPLTARDASAAAKKQQHPRPSTAGPTRPRSAAPRMTTPAKPLLTCRAVSVAVLEHTNYNACPMATNLRMDTSRSLAHLLARQTSRDKVPTHKGTRSPSQAVSNRAVGASPLLTTADADSSVVPTTARQQIVVHMHRMHLDDDDDDDDNPVDNIPRKAFLSRANRAAWAE